MDHGEHIETVCEPCFIFRQAWPSKNAAFELGHRFIVQCLLISGVVDDLNGEFFILF